MMDKLPNNPDIVYRGRGWKGWGDFLGTGHDGRTDDDTRNQLFVVTCDKFRMGKVLSEQERLIISDILRNWMETYGIE